MVRLTSRGSPVPLCVCEATRLGRPHHETRDTRGPATGKQDSRGHVTDADGAQQALGLERGGRHNAFTTRLRNEDFSCLGRTPTTTTTTTFTTALCRGTHSHLPHRSPRTQSALIYLGSSGSSRVHQVLRCSCGVCVLMSILVCVVVVMCGRGFGAPEK